MRMISRIFGIVLLLFTTMTTCHAQNQYFTPNYQSATPVYVDPFSNPVCGPSACGYVLPTQTLNPYQPFPKRYSPVLIDAAPLSSYEIYMRSGNSYGSFPAYNRYQPRYTPSYKPSDAAPASNMDIYRR